MFSTARHSVLRHARTQLRTTHPTLALSHSQSSLTRLLSTLAILEQKDGQLSQSSLSAVSAGLKLSDSVTGFIAGSDAKSVAESSSKISGLSKIIYVSNAAYDKGLPENWAPLLQQNIEKGGYTHILAPHSAFAKSTIPRLAALLDTQQISDITAIESEDTFVRPIYAGNAILTCQSSDTTKCITVRGTAFPPPETSGGNASLEEGVDPNASCPTTWVSEDLQKSDRPDLGSAEKVVSGGRGLKSKEEFDRLMPPLADALGAAIGASRAAVDSGFADNSLQVGQTGKNVAPQLYLCAGISGAIQHLAGMKDSKVIAAINKDPEAPIFQVADVGLVGDLFEKVPELTEKLKAQ
ncbi:electron transfer flavo protein-like protein subunit alpha [Lophiostoma macrostomum CBS 122681]|uniref:Probable electron transfer flavoprotein subunit alpha n=1 Tax=Lophiostoma macrostomum CBS 122681 TaxID=1314788 RepID=A0A6A6TG19_9PLEO|nr:electron transfer flavo protein-like protein subunit alpha [Lophiostoma macrostomum CBS 122681]